MIVPHQCFLQCSQSGTSSGTDLGDQSCPVVLDTYHLVNKLSQWGQEVYTLPICISECLHKNQLEPRPSDKIRLLLHEAQLVFPILGYVSCAEGEYQLFLTERMA